MIKRPASRTIFENVLNKEPQPGLLIVHSRPMIASASDKVLPMTERNRARGFEGLFSEIERGMFNALRAYDAHPRNSRKRPG